jgi:REP element-mobilizing transposase RayT
MRNVCTHRGWGLIAVHVRANHVHVVADIDVDPSRAIGDLKAYACRALNEATRREHRWGRHGSVKLLSTHAAVRYVTVNQGEPMAVFVAARNG